MLNDLSSPHVYYRVLLIASSTFCQNRDNTIHASLYPVLVILSRLYPSSMDGVDTVLSMEMFLPYVIR